MLSNPLRNIGEEQSSQKYMSVTAEGNVLFLVISGNMDLSLPLFKFFFIYSPVINVHIIFYNA